MTTGATKKTPVSMISPAASTKPAAASTNPPPAKPRWQFRSRPRNTILGRHRYITHFAERCGPRARTIFMQSRPRKLCQSMSVLQSRTIGHNQCALEHSYVLATNKYEITVLLLCPEEMPSLPLLLLTSSKKGRGAHNAETTGTAEKSSSIMFQRSDNCVFRKGILRDSVDHRRPHCARHPDFFSQQNSSPT